MEREDPDYLHPSNIVQQRTGHCHLLKRVDITCHYQRLRSKMEDVLAPTEEMSGRWHPSKNFQQRKPADRCLLSHA